ncbi:MAG: chorismate mutase, partial [Actinomycetota bacterium]
TDLHDGKALRALRGATTARSDDAAEIAVVTQELLAEMFERNSISRSEVVSIIFTATPDLTAEFPAAAARSAGISDVPLLCAQEMAVPGAVERCIRVLMHLYTAAAPETLKHVYLRDARQLRTDLPE